MRRELLVLCAAAGCMVTPANVLAETAPQYIIVSFDGALDVEQWERSRALAAETGATFTYFLSCVYVLSRETREAYRAPDTDTTRSNVGYGYSREDVAARLDHIWSARAEGHEIANHGCGHFDGSEWTSTQWTTELERFHAILADSWSINGIEGEPQGWRDFAASEIDGFRAPYLAVGDGLFAALAAQGYRYDASTVSQGPQPPMDRDGMTRFSLPMIPEGSEGRPVLAMDYNLFVRHSAGIERPDRDGVFEERTLASFEQALETELDGERIPLQMGFHFTLMNGGAYWNALERFLRANCMRAGIECISHRDYLDKMTATTEAGG